MKEIILINNKGIAFVDDEDYEKVKNIKWYYDRGYAIKSIRNSNCKIKYLHRFILNAIDSNIHVDHINGNKLDDQKTNLRLVNNQQNHFNSKLAKNNKCGYKGVRFIGKKYRTSIMYNYKNIHIGMFDDIIEAAKAYDKKALELFGKYANLNFPIHTEG